MLVVRPLCEEGINSLSYNHLLNKKEPMKTNEYEEIYSINNQNIQKFINAII